MNAIVPTPSMTSAEDAFARERSTGTKSMTANSVVTLKTRARTIVPAAMPARCVSRGTGAMKVYSIVPSQRSQAMISAMFSKTRPMNRQAIVPTSRYRTNRPVCTGSVALPEMIGAANPM